MISIYIDSSSAVPIYKQIAHQTSFLIAGGMLEENERLPSVRKLAKSLAVNPMTVSRAYSELEREKTVYCLRGRGVYVGSFMLKKKEKLAIIENHIKDAVYEAKSLGLPQKEVIGMAMKLFRKCKGKTEVSRKEVK